MSASRPSSSDTTLAEPMAKLAISEAEPATEQSTSAELTYEPCTPLDLDRLGDDKLNKLTFRGFHEIMYALSEVCRHAIKFFLASYPFLLPLGGL